MHRSSIWINSDSSQESCKWIRIQFACGGSVAGYVYPTCILISVLSDTKLPTRNIIVVHIEGL